MRNRVATVPQAVAFALALVIGAFAVSSPTARAATARETFMQRATRVAADKKLGVCRWGQLRYDKRSGAPGYFAVMRGPEGLPKGVLFARGSFEKWHEGDDETETLRIDCADELNWEELAKLQISFSGGASYRHSEEVVTFIDGDLVELTSGSSDVDSSGEGDWEHAVRRSQPRNDQTGEMGKEQLEGLIAVLPPASRWIAAWRTPTFVTFGAKTRRSRADADIAVKAVDADADTVRILVDIKDDRLVPVAAGADDKQFLRGDHLELWWSHPGSGNETAGNRQLAVGLLADGGVDVRWLIPPPVDPKQLPVARRDGWHVEIDLPVPRLTSREGGGVWTVPFTVAFSDADDPKAGQQAVVATSMLRWNQTDTFGELARFDNSCRRFPSF